jgi:hypothetical protein
MNPHLIHIPRLAPLAARRLAGRNLQALRGQPHGALHAQILGLGALDELLADFLEGGDFARGQSYADLVGFGRLVGVRVAFVGFGERHGGYWGRLVGGDGGGRGGRTMDASQDLNGCSVR